MLLFVAGCPMKNPLTDMRFQTVTAPPYVVSSWYKITAPGETVKFYIDDFGDAENPNPPTDFMRRLAGDDENPNVVYLALPCQYGVHVGCADGGLKPAEAVKSLNTAVETMMKKARADKMVIVGYGVGADYGGQIAVKHLESVNHFVSIGGIWDETPGLRIMGLKQTHYVGAKDDRAKLPVFLPPESIVNVKKATHTDGYGAIKKYIWNLK